MINPDDPDNPFSPVLCLRVPHSLPPTRCLWELTESYFAALTSSWLPCLLFSFACPLHSVEKTSSQLKFCVCVCVCGWRARERERVASATAAADKEAREGEEKEREEESEEREEVCHSRSVFRAELPDL